MMSKSDTLTPTLNTSNDVVPSMYTEITNTVLSVPDGCVLKQVSQFIPWDNEDNLVPKQVEDIVNILFTGIVLPLLFLVSFSTNILNMVVFFKHGLQERINVCLFTLSLLDCVFVTIAYGYSSDVLYMFAIGKGDEIGAAAKFFIQSHLIGLHGLISSSQVVSTAIAFERCLCITRPLLVKSLMSTKTTAVLLWTFVLLILGGMFVVAGLRYGLICIFDPEDSSTLIAMYPSEFYLQNKFILDFMYGFVAGLFFPGLCITCVTVCTVITVAKMKKLSQWRETVSSASHSFTSRDLAITRMIVGSSVLFIVCFMPGSLISVCFLVVPDLTLGGRYNNLYLVCVRCFQLASTINCTFNFFVYYVYGSKFRETVHQLFSSYICCSDKKHTESLTSNR